MIDSSKTDILNGDCSELLNNIPDNSIQTIITSPPYNLSKSYEDKQNLNDYLEFYKSIIFNIKRILKDSGSVFWQVGNFVSDGEIFPLDIYFYSLFKEAGFKLRNRTIWHFGHGLHCKHRFSHRYETILFFTKGDDYIFNLDSVRVPSKYPNKKYFKGPRKGELSCNPLGKNPSDVWNIGNIKHNHPEKTEHPCMFPIELCERCILVSSNEGDTILDPFCGSGQAIIAAVKNNRIGIGIDKEANYCNLSKKRLLDFYSGNLKIKI